MATAADIDADLTLEITGKNVTPEKFMRGVRAFFGLINEVTRGLATPGQFVHWTVQVKSGSNLIGIVPTHFTVPPSVLDNIIVTVQEGIESIENEAEEPQGLPEPATRQRDRLKPAG